MHEYEAGLNKKLIQER